MVRITVELIRKRSEHNDCEISTLEEIALHQENIDKIEMINRLCRHLKILLLQNNLITKIENLNMLKKLEYLNLAINNIEIIENLERLESLQKLDLTLNFIGDLRSIKNLRYNENLKQLFLTGNPCADYTGYRDYVIATLPQLKELDMTEITRSERITALQRHAEVEGDVIRDYRSYSELRAKQIHHHLEERKCHEEEFKPPKANTCNESDKHNWNYNNNNGNDNINSENEDNHFWGSKSHHTPEDRIAIADRMQKISERKNKSSEDKLTKPKYVPKLFNSDGLAYNLNQAKVSFILNDEENRENIILTVSVYKHLDSSLLNVDIQPTYIRVTIKGKILQLRLPCEVSTDKSFATRNIITGNLIVTMLRLKPLSTILATLKPQDYSSSQSLKDNHSQTVRFGAMLTKRQLLEIGPPNDEMDFSQIYKNSKILQNSRDTSNNDTNNSDNNKISKKNITADYVDNPEVPPLE